MLPQKKAIQLTAFENNKLFPDPFRLNGAHSEKPDVKIVDYCSDCNWVACVTPAPGHCGRAIKMAA